MAKLTLFVAAIPILAACGKDSRAGFGPGSSPAEIASRAKSSAAQAKESISKALAEFRESSDQALAKIDHQIADLRLKAPKARESIRGEIDRALATLGEQRKALSQKLDELKSAAPDDTSARMEEVKSTLLGLRRSLEELEAQL